MSSAQSNRGMHKDAQAGSRDPRNLLVSVVVDAVKQLEPRVVVVENVPAFLRRRVEHPRTKKPVAAARLLADALSSQYRVFPFVSDLADYGVPQTRKRCFLTFIRSDEPAAGLLAARGLMPYPRPSHDESPISVVEALQGFSRLNSCSARYASDIENELHCVPVLEPERYRMIAAIPKNSGRSAWENGTCRRCGRSTRDEERVRCSRCDELLLRPIVIDQESGAPRLIAGFRASSYARLHPERPASTITTASGNVGSDRTIHPSEHRVLSVLECATLQTFPRDFRWGDAVGRRRHTKLREMIGEAVPPLFTRKHGRVIAAALRGKRPYGFLDAADVRATRASDALAAS
jgi:DNA (cytosine-5)-methyltransferase 1